ncbi:MAG: hypothetical protein VKO64_03425 [Candidatus Sericytochromatia bacterium]|nr:hypothetical protein [Candidatus Sericytochromatia bacterium]
MATPIRPGVGLWACIMGVLVGMTGCVTPRIQPFTGTRILTTTLLPTPVRARWREPEGLIVAMLAAGSSRVAIGRQDGRVTLHALNTGEALREWTIEGELTALLPLDGPRTELAAVTSEGGVVHLDVDEDEPVATLSTGLTVERAGRWFGPAEIWVRQGDTVVLLDLDTAELRTPPLAGPWWATALSPDGERLILTREDAPPSFVVLPTDAANGSTPERTTIWEDLPFALMPAWSSDGQGWTLAGEGKVWVETPTTNGEMFAYVVGIPEPQSVAFLPSGRTIGVAGENRLQLVSARSGRVLHSLQGSAAPVWLPVKHEVVHALTPGLVSIVDAGAY